MIFNTKNHTVISKIFLGIYAVYPNKVCLQIQGWLPIARPEG